MRHAPRQRIAAAAVLVGLVLWLPATPRAAGDEGDDGADGLIRRVVAQTTRTNLSIRSTRELQAGTVSGKHRGWMTVATVVTPAGTFTWDVVTEGGSDRTRKRVFRALLDGEGDTWRSGGRDEAALTPANYEFEPLPSEDGAPMRLRVKPRRADPRLIDGILIVSADGYPLRLEGRMAKSPSFWVKSVTVVKRYGRFAGVALPISIESLADLKLFGQSTFTMRYAYHEVNGQPIAHGVASAPLQGPSAEILALHSSRRR